MDRSIVPHGEFPMNRKDYFPDLELCYMPKLVSWSRVARYVVFWFLKVDHEYPTFLSLSSSVRWGSQALETIHRHHLYLRLGRAKYLLKLQYDASRHLRGPMIPIDMLSTSFTIVSTRLAWNTTWTINVLQYTVWKICFQSSSLAVAWPPSRSEFTDTNNLPLTRSNQDTGSSL